MLKKLSLFAFVVIILLPFAKVQDSKIKYFLKKENLWEKYQQKIEDINSNGIDKKWTDKLQHLVENTIECPLNNSYKTAYVNNVVNNFPIVENVNMICDIKYMVCYDPVGGIKYLEQLKERQLSESLQLMILWQIYTPSILETEKYSREATAVHNNIIQYFEEKKWQSSWRKEEYEQLIKDDYQKCYKNLECLLELIPYWRDDAEVYIPCQVAQKYNKVAYLDVAAGGHGATAFMTSDCGLYDKYSYNADLGEYTYMLYYESIPEGDGSIRFLYQAKAVYNDLIKHYQPDFNLPHQYDWAEFPYTEWAVQSYFSFKKYNEVLNFGVGYKKALSLLTEHYMEKFGVEKDKAYNTALYTLALPSFEHWEMIDKDNLYYMLLTGIDFDRIKEKHPDLKDYKNLLQFSIAYPENLKKIIFYGEQEKEFNIDEPNEFGKTPLMWAAQYGYLDSVKILLAHGADINKQTDDSDCAYEEMILCIHTGRRTALMYAEQEGQYEVALYLLQAGADKNLKDSQGKIAYDYAIGAAPMKDPDYIMTINSGDSRERDPENRTYKFSPSQLKNLK